MASNPMPLGARVSAALEMLAFQCALADLGVELYVNASRKLAARAPAGVLVPDLRDGIERWKSHLLCELLVAETYEWEATAWTADEHTRMLTAVPADLHERLSTAAKRAWDSCRDGATDTALDALKAYREALRAAASIAGVRDASFPENPGEYRPNHDPKTDDTKKEAR